MFDIEKARQKGFPENTIKIMENINENNKKRESYIGHEFEEIKMFEHRCKKCGYVADIKYIQGYNDALKHVQINHKEVSICRLNGKAAAGQINRQSDTTAVHGLSSW